MDQIPRPWNHLLLIVISYAMLAAAEWHLTRKAVANQRRLSWSQRLALYAFVALLTVLTIEAPLWTMGGALAIVIVLLLLIVVLFAFIHYYISSANRILVEANRLADEGQVAAAIGLLERNVDRQISRDRSLGGVILVTMARFYGKQKEWQAADLAVERAIELLPNDPLLIDTKVVLLRDRGQSPEARRLMESILPLHAKSAALLTTYAEILIDQGEWGAAHETIKQIDLLLDSQEFVGVADPRQWRTARLEPLQYAIQRRHPVAS